LELELTTFGNGEEYVYAGKPGASRYRYAERVSGGEISPRVFRTSYLTDGVSTTIDPIDIHSLLQFSDGSPFETLIGCRRLREDTETELAEELRNIPGTVIRKNVYCAFTRESEQLLKENRWNTLILCVVATESCVMKTAVDAFERHLVPLVVVDATAGDAGHELHQAGLMVLRRFIRKDQLVTTSTFLRDYDDFGRYSDGNRWN